MIVKGCETQGFVIVAMAKARILSCDHNPVWWHHQLKSKDTWVGDVECMQVSFILLPWQRPGSCHVTSTQSGGIISLRVKIPGLER